MSLIKELAGEKQGDFRQFCLKNIILDNGKAYDPYGRPCMVEITDQLFIHPHLCIEKGEQTGFSTAFIAYCLYMVDQQRRNGIYFLPTDEFVSLFTPTRFDPTIERSSYLTSRLSHTDNRSAKQIGGNFLYVRGLKSKTGAISVPADFIAYDEVALTDKANLELAEGRIAASDLAHRRYFSAPLFEEDNIDEIFQQSDQRHWMMTCSSCRKDQIAEEHFPDNLVKPKGGQAFLACYHCGNPLDLARGVWVAKHPDRTERIGYRVPQLIIPGMNLDLAYDRTQDAVRRPSRMAQVKRSVCGVPAAGDMQPISDSVVTRVSTLDPYPLHSHSEQPTYMGIDMGDLCHLVIRQPAAPGKVRWIWFEVVSAEDIAAVAKVREQQFNVACTVVDAMPYKPESKKLVRGLQRQAAIHYFRGSDTKEGTEGDADRAVPMVTTDRDELIDEMVDELRAEPPFALLPQPRDEQQERLMGIVRRQLKKLVKEERETPNGKVVSYKDGTENHFGLAMTYALIAQRIHHVTNFDYQPAVSRRAAFPKGAY